MGNAAAVYNLGICYYNGTGVGKNLKKSADLIRKAKKLGHEGAVKALPVALCEAGIDSYEQQSYEDAFNLLEEAAGLGDTDAMAKLAVMYHKGIYVKKDEKEAYRLFLASVKGGVDHDDAEILTMYFDTVEVQLRLMLSLESSRTSLANYLPKCIVTKRVIKEPAIPRGLFFVGIFKGIIWGFWHMLAGGAAGMIPGFFLPSNFMNWMADILRISGESRIALMVPGICIGAVVGFARGYIRDFKEMKAEQAEARKARELFRKHKNEFKRVESERVKNAALATEAVKKQLPLLDREIARVTEQVASLKNKVIKTGDLWEKDVIEAFNDLRWVLSQEKVLNLDHLLQRYREIKAESRRQAREESEEMARAKMAAMERDKISLSDVLDAGLVATTLESGKSPFLDPDAVMAMERLRQRNTEREERAQEIEKGF